MKKIIFFSFIFLISSCINNNKNQQDISTDLSIINTHIPDNENGEKIFNYYCSTCHLYGTGGATLIGDKNSWNNLLKNNY